MKQKKINSKLFDSQILDKQLVHAVGGMPHWTTKNDDTSLGNGNSDILFGTLDAEGDKNCLDINDTGSTTKDTPL